METISVMGVLTGTLFQFWPVWLALILVFIISFKLKRHLGLYGQLFDSGVGLSGGLVMTESTCDANT